MLANRHTQAASDMMRVVTDDLNDLVRDLFFSDKKARHGNPSTADLCGFYCISSYCHFEQNDYTTLCPICQTLFCNFCTQNSQNLQFILKISP
jgi:hypothetical protein